MRLWDLRAPHCQGLLEVPSGIPTAAFDLQVTSDHHSPLGLFELVEVGGWSSLVSFLHVLLT